MAEVSGGQVRGRRRLDWLDGVKVALGNKGKSGEPWYMCTRPFWLGTVFFRTALPCSGGYHMRGEKCHYMMWLG